jgi:hypothetical protein
VRLSWFNVDCVHQEWAPRPLEERLDQVLEFMVARLCGAHGVQYHSYDVTDKQHHASTDYLRSRLSALARPAPLVAPLVVSSSPQPAATP